MLKIKQYFCKHDFKYLARHQFSSQNLWHCKKCGVFYIQHYNLGIGYKHTTPHLEHWIYE